MSRAQLFAAIAFLAAIGAVAVASADSNAPSSPAAANGTLAGTVVPALRPTAGAVTTVRAIDATTVTTTVTGRVGANGRYRLAAPPGVYLVLVEKVGARTRPIQGFGRLVRVRSGRTATLPPVAPGSAGPQRAPAGVAPAAAYRGTAGQPAVAVKYFTGTGPNAYLGKGLSTIIVTGLVGGRCYVVVEWERRADILAELRFQQSKYVDPSTRLTPRLIQPTIFVEGSVSTTASSTSWSIRMRDVATGRIIGSDSGSAGAGADVFDAIDAAARRLREQLEKELCLPTRFRGSFSGNIGGSAAGGGGGGMSFTGTITFVRSANQSLAAPGFIHYSVERVDYTSTATITFGDCSGTDTDTVSLRNEDPRASALQLATRITPNKGRAYLIVTFHQKPQPKNLTVNCSSGPFVTPWTPAATISTALGGDYYADGSRLRGTNNAQGGNSYSWDLTGGS